MHSDVTHQIIGAAYEVHRHRGHGFLEAVYEKSLMLELAARGLRAGPQVAMTVTYKDVPVGIYVADLLVNDAVICEIKAVRRLLPEHEAQLLHYLKATNMKVGLLLNFGGTSVQVKRMVL